MNFSSSFASYSALTLTHSGQSSSSAWGEHVAQVRVLLLVVLERAVEMRAQGAGLRVDRVFQPGERSRQALNLVACWWTSIATCDSLAY